MKFKPGQSGNPGGRPKVVHQVRALAQEHSPEAVEILVKIMHDAKEAVHARIAASKLILEYAIGRPMQSIELGLTNELDGTALESGLTPGLVELIDSITGRNKRMQSINATPGNKEGSEVQVVKKNGKVDQI